MLHKNYYQLPLRNDHGADVIVWSTNNIRAFDVMYQDAHFTPRAIVEILNGNLKLPTDHKITYKDGYVFIGDEKLLSIRGWGALTGVGGYSFPHNVATDIQDSFGNWIAETLKR
jgi:hypothetical protein